MERKRTEFLVGLFVLAGFLALLFVSLKAANLGNFSFSAMTVGKTDASVLAEKNKFDKGGVK